MTLRRLGWRLWLKNKKIWVAADTWPQEMSLDKILRSGRRLSKSEKPKDGAGDFAQAAFVASASLDFPFQESLEK
jgi:predicted acyl esterase